jgi:hypothetical protein
VSNRASAAVDKNSFDMMSFSQMRMRMLGANIDPKVRGVKIIGLPARNVINMLTRLSGN